MRVVDGETYFKALFVFAAFFAFLLGMILFNLVSHPCECKVASYVDYPKRSVLLIHSDDQNVSEMVSLAKEYGIDLYHYIIESPPYYIRLGGRYVPLTPPVVMVPSYLCVTDDNRLIAGRGTDLNAFKNFLIVCGGLDEGSD